MAQFMMGRIKGELVRLVEKDSVNGKLTIDLALPRVAKGAIILEWREKFAFDMPNKMQYLINSGYACSLY